MGPLDLNLASRPTRNNTLLWIGHGVLAILLITATAWNTSNYLHHRAELGRLRVDKNSLDSHLADLQRREAAARRGVAAHDLDELTVQASKAADVIRRKALSWTRLFNLIENILPYEVRMISVRPVFVFSRTGGQPQAELPPGTVPVSVEGSAKSLNDMLEFQRALIFDEHFDQVEPHRFQQTSAGEVLFDLRFLYDPNGVPAAPDEDADSGEEGEGESGPGGLQAAVDDAGPGAADGAVPASGAAASDSDDQDPGPIEPEVAPADAGDAGGTP